MSEADEVTVYDRLVWPEGAIEQSLVSGQRRRELLAFLGEQDYARLQPMAVAAARATRDPGHSVYVVPGIMGSQLCLPRERPLPDDLLWLDPADFQRGRMLLLAWSSLPMRSCGPVPYNYLPLKLALEAAGYTVRGFDYDWRRDVAEVGIELARRIAIDPAREISVVCHSLGGLVGRAALRTESGQRIHRLITLGTPHAGTYAPVQALRGTYPLVRRLAQLDPHHSAEELAREVFATFHSLYQMLPRGGGALDLLDARNWPVSGPQPNATLLDRVPKLDLGGADARISAIAGYGFDTAVNLTRVQDDFYYRYEAAGDGTVPTARATLPGSEAWYARVMHNELTRDPVIHAAVAQLLADAAPGLPNAPPATGGQPRSVSDHELRAQYRQKVDWSGLDAMQRRRFLDSLNEAPPPVS